MRAVTIAAFLAVVLGIVAALHAYVWARLVRDPVLGTLATRALSVVVVALALGVPAAFILGRLLPPSRGQSLLLVLFTWLGVVFWLVLGLAVADLCVFIGRHLGGLAGASFDPQRRLFVARAVAGSVVALTGGATIAGMRSALGPIAIREVRVGLGRLPASLDGMTLVQLTDLHIGPTLRERFVAHVVERVNALDADAVVITGDLVDGSVAQLRTLVAPLGALRARYGVFFVTGNHEYYSGAEAWCEELGRLGIRVLRNQRVAIGEGDDLLDLAGVDDWDAQRHPETGHGLDLNAALAGRDPSRELVLLAHQPRVIHLARQQGVGLMLAGHTHGGQIWPWAWAVRLQQPVVRGLHRFGLTQLYVSSGTGHWGPALRLGAPAEITRLTLERALEPAPGTPTPSGAG